MKLSLQSGFRNRTVPFSILVARLLILWNTALARDPFFVAAAEVVKMAP